MTHEDDALLAAWRAAIAVTDAAERTERLHRNRVELQSALLLAEDDERLAGRAYLAARDRAVAAQVAGSDQGPGVTDSAGDNDAIR